MRRVHTCAGADSVRYPMHLVCPQPFLSQNVTQPALVTFCSLQQTDHWAFNDHSAPRESQLNPSECKAPHGLLRCVFFINLEEGDFSLYETRENRPVKTSRHSLLCIFRCDNSEIPKLYSSLLRTRNLLHSGTFIASCSELKTIVTH